MYGLPTMTDYSDYSKGAFPVIKSAGMVKGFQGLDYSDYMITDISKGSHETDKYMAHESHVNIYALYIWAGLLWEICNHVIRVSNTVKRGAVIASVLITAVCNHCNQERKVSGRVGRGACKTTIGWLLTFIIGSYEAGT
jgi:hypothetical protein